MFYLRYKDGSLLATTRLPLRNVEDYTEITKEEYDAFMEQFLKDAEAEATEAEYLEALEVLGVSE